MAVNYSSRRVTNTTVAMTSDRLNGLSSRRRSRSSDRCRAPQCGVDEPGYRADESPW